MAVNDGAVVIEKGDRVKCNSPEHKGNKEFTVFEVKANGVWGPQFCHNDRDDLCPNEFVELVRKGGGEIFTGFESAEPGKVEPVTPISVGPASQSVGTVVSTGQPVGTSFVPNPQFLQTQFHQCRHRPTLVLKGTVGRGEKWEVWAGSKAKVEDRAWEFDLIINCTGNALTNHRKNTIPKGLMDDKWISPVKGREIVIDWPDYGIPSMPLGFWKALINLIKRNERTLVFCIGGHGRTGTCLSILAMLIKGMTPGKAVKFVRSTLCEECVESQKQLAYIMRLGQMAGVKVGKPAVKTGGVKG